ncbi:MAG: encapsulin [Prochloraceae cyanobacterium]|nr:encapsulin [Prochloraceae cyanobacterium]
MANEHRNRFARISRQTLKGLTFDDCIDTFKAVEDYCQFLVGAGQLECDRDVNAAELKQIFAPRSHTMNMTLAMEQNLRRKELPWDDEIWNRIDRAVHDECKRTKIACKFLPLHGPVESGKLTVPSDTIEVDENNRLQVPEARTDYLLELVVEFVLTLQQVEREEELGTAVTLATRAANLLSQAFDVVIFQGVNSITPGENQHPLFRDRKVIARSGPANQGLLNAPRSESTGEDNLQQIIHVPALETPGPQQRWGENTFGAVSEAYARLQGGEGLAQAHYGPYALVLNFVPYADTYAPLPTTLIMPADRIARLVTNGFYGMKSRKDMSYEKEMQSMGNNSSTHSYGGCTHFYGTGTLPPLKGVLVSLGGNTMDLVVGMDDQAEYVTQDAQGNFCFRVYERFALRLKDKTAVMRLEFDK